MKSSDDFVLGPFRSVGVIGAGAWGTALAQVAAVRGLETRLWAFEADLVETIETTRENRLYLPGAHLDARIAATNDLAFAAAADVVLAATPAQHFRATLRRLSPLVPAGRMVVVCAKGIEQGTLCLMTDVLAAEAPHVLPAVLSGPGFARDVVRGLPTATTIACGERARGAALAAALGGSTFRPYVTEDLVGAEIGGAVKNVIAIACGIAEGRELGDGARAALITRGFAELMRLGLALGAKPATLNGLCGLGDLVLTCSSQTSRNTSLGVAIGQGRRAADVLGERRSVAEGASTAPAVVALGARCGVEMPICAAVDAILASRIDVDAAIRDLLARPFREEGW